jgi:hypothetical protein
MGAPVLLHLPNASCPAGTAERRSSTSRADPNAVCEALNVVCMRERPNMELDESDSPLYHHCMILRIRLAHPANQRQKRISFTEHSTWYRQGEFDARSVPSVHEHPHPNKHASCGIHQHALHMNRDFPHQDAAIMKLIRTCIPCERALEQELFWMIVLGNQAKTSLFSEALGRGKMRVLELNKLHGT